MRRTIKITVRHLIKGWGDFRLNIEAWWLEIGLRGHKIIVISGVAVLFGVTLILFSSYLGLDSRIYYRQKIEQNENKLERLEKQK